MELKYPTGEGREHLALNVGLATHSNPLQKVALW